MTDRSGWIDFIFAVFGFGLATLSFILNSWVDLRHTWILKYGCYVGIFTWMIFSLSLKLRAENVDPRSKIAFKEYLKLGSFLCFVFIVMEIPIWLAVLKS